MNTPRESRAKVKIHSSVSSTGPQPTLVSLPVSFVGKIWVGRSALSRPTDRGSDRDHQTPYLEKTPYLPTIGGACQHRDNLYLPTPATLTYHKRKVCRRFGDRLTFSLPGLAAVSLSGDSGAVSVIGSAPGSACARVLIETAIKICTGDPLHFTLVKSSQASRWRFSSFRRE